MPLTTPPSGPPRHSVIKQALPERAVVALTLRQEAAAEFSRGRWTRAPVETRIAVACVIGHRVKSPGRFGASFKDVCLKPSAFSCWLNIGDRNSNETFALGQSLLDGAPVTDATLRECFWIADGLIAGAITDQVQGATHYHADWMQKAPRWTEGVAPVCKVGNHLFYAGIR